jgi:MinD superfamily P-loop ATPase
MGLCFGVVINRDGIGDAGVDLFCQKEDIPVLLRIPHDARIAFHYSNGEAFVKEMPEMNQGFLQLFKRIQEKVA